MKISQIFQKQEKTFSFEFFPPKDEISAVDLGINIGQLINLSPSFITVTYGAGGSTQEKTFKLVDYLQSRIGLTCMAHYTCVNASIAKIEQDIKVLQCAGIKNLMLLRGDPPGGSKIFSPHPQGFKYASELITHVKTLGDFCIGGAAYPEGHPESLNAETDVINLRHKINAGAEFLITQMFFDNDIYFDFVEKARKNGITARIIPGIIPITNYKQVKKFISLSNASIPTELTEQLDEFQNDAEKIYNIGVEYAVKQCKKLLERGAPGIHFYTLNKSRATVDIFQSLMA